jgi:hypothetical protein
MTCPVCCGPMHVALLGVPDPQSGHAFSIVRCARCHLGMTLPEPEDLDRITASTTTAEGTGSRGDIAPGAVCV